MRRFNSVSFNSAVKEAGEKALNDAGVPFTAVEQAYVRLVYDTLSCLSRLVMYLETPRAAIVQRTSWASMASRL